MHLESGDLQMWILPEKLHEAISFIIIIFYFLKQVPIYFSCLGERCFTVKL